MLAGRLVPHRLIAPALLLGLAACASDRYVGSIGRDGTYSNRGYGVAIPLQQATLDARWTAIDPSDLEAAPADQRPVVRDAPLDLDGDGQLDMGETTRFVTPMLRLLSKTSTGAVMSIDVTILGSNNMGIDLEALLVLELQKITKTSSTAQGTMESVANIEVPSGYRARIAEVKTEHRVYRIALVDQNDFTSEMNTPRRQIVRVLLGGKELTPELRSDQDKLLHHLFLARRGGTPTSQEIW